MNGSLDLAVVSTFSVGYDHIDLNAAADREIDVSHTLSVLTETTANLTWALLSDARRTVEGHEYVRTNEWKTWGPKLLTGPDVHQATLGIVGLGQIGMSVARPSVGFEIEVLYSGRRRNEKREEEPEQFVAVGLDATYINQDELLAESDFVSLHIPLVESTYHLIGEDELRQISEDAILLNTSRELIVETEALDNALEQGWIVCGGIFVTDLEPFPADHRLIYHALEKCVVTPILEVKEFKHGIRRADMAAENVQAGIEGELVPHSVLHNVGMERSSEYLTVTFSTINHPPTRHQKNGCLRRNSRLKSLLSARIPFVPFSFYEKIVELLLWILKYV